MTGRLRRRRDEQGAIAAMTAVLLVVVLAIAAFAVDIGMQRVVRSDMQAVADVVALDAARLIDGRTAGQIRAGGDGKPSLATTVAQSVARNNTTLGDIEDVRAELVYVDVGRNGALVPRRDGSGAVLAVPSAQKPQGVYVTAKGLVDFAFAAGSGSATRNALAKTAENACFRLGSYAAALDSSNSSILADLIGDAINVNGVGYQGLVNANVTLFGLATELGVGSVEQLAALNYLTLRELFLASARALQNNGGEAADVAVLNTLAARVDGSLRISFSDLMDLSTAGPAALDTAINVLDLVAGSALVANGESFLDLGVVWNVPQVSQGPAHLKLVQRAQHACGLPGSARAETAQLTMEAYPDLNVPTIAGLAGPKVTMGLVVRLAGAEGTLTSIRCGTGTVANPDAVGVRVSRSLVSTVNLTVPVRLTGRIKARDLITNPLLFGLVGVIAPSARADVDITVDLGYTSSTSPSTVDATYAVPPRDYTDPEPVGGTTGVVLPHSSLNPSRVTGTVSFNGRTVNLSGPLAGVTLEPIFDDIIKKNVLRGVNGFIDNINDRLTGVASLLGLQVAGADLYGIRKPVCNDPRLAG